MSATRRPLADATAAPLVGEAAHSAGPTSQPKGGGWRDWFGGRWGRGLLITLAYSLATVAMTWPYARHPGSTLVDELDPFFQVWVTRWVQHALVTDPLHLYDANAFYPLKTTLAYSDSNVPAALLAAPIYLLTGNAILANNLLTLGSFVLAAGGSYLLVSHLSGNRTAGFLAGLAYAFLPYRYVHLWHLNQLGQAWTPWVLYSLVLLVQLRIWRLAGIFGLLLAVQCLSSFYLAFQIAIAVGFALLVAVIAEPRARSRAFLVRLAVALALAAALILPLAWPYLQVRAEQGLERTVGDADKFSWKATPDSYLRVPRGNRVWSGLTNQDDGEYTLFPGGVALAGAVVGLLGARRRRAATTALLLIGVAGFILSFGPSWESPTGATRPLPYRFLFDHVAIFRALRVPARFGALVGFAVVGLAGLGAAWAWERLRGRLRRRDRRVVGGVLTAILAATILVELYSGPPRLERVDSSPAIADAYYWLARQPGNDPIMEFPAGRYGKETAFLMYWSTVHWKPMVQGYSGFEPPLFVELIKSFSGDVTRADGSVARRVSHVNRENIGVVQDLGVRYLVLHRYGYKRNDWDAVIAALEATGPAVEFAGDFGEAVIYRVLPFEQPPPVIVTLDAPMRLQPGEPWEPVLTLRNERDRYTLVNLTAPLRLTVIWRDERGREVRRDVDRLPLPPLIAPGDFLCAPRGCAQDYKFGDLAPAPALLARVPTSPGRYSVQLDVTGDVTASRTLAVEVGAASGGGVPPWEAAALVALGGE